MEATHEDKQRLDFGIRAIMEKWVHNLSVALVWGGSKAWGGRTVALISNWNILSP